MPHKKSVDPSAPVRRSPRAPASDQAKSRKRKSGGTVKVKFGPGEPYERHRHVSPPPVPAQRTNSLIPVQGITLTNSFAALNNISHTTTAVRKSNTKVDAYCWLCHSEGNDQVCSICPRAFHHQCLNAAHRFTENQMCPECRLKSTDGTELSSDLTLERLTELLPIVLKRLIQRWPMFETWPCNLEQNSKLVCLRDLTVLKDRLNMEDMRYSSTAEFLADVKWIQHNCHISYGPKDKLTVKAKSLVKDCKDQLMDLEACHECYETSDTYDMNFFAKVCNKPHALVWVKLKGFPYWPAKVLKVIDGNVNVTFFGTHDKSKVAVKDCFALSEKNPGDKVPTRHNYAVAEKELREYVKNYVDIYEKFQYASLRDPFIPTSVVHVTRANKRGVRITSPSGPAGKRTKINAKSKQEANTSSDAVVVLEENGVLSDEPEVINISETEDDTDEATDVEIVRDPGNSQSNFLGNLQLTETPFTSERNSEVLNSRSPLTPPVQMVGFSSRVVDSGNNVQMDFVIDGSAESTVEPLREYQKLSATEKPRHSSIEEVVAEVVSELETNIALAASGEEPGSTDATIEVPSVSENADELEIEIVHESANPGPPVSVIGFDASEITIAEEEEQAQQAEETYAIPLPLTANKFADKISSQIQSTVLGLAHAMWNSVFTETEVQAAFVTMQKEIAELKEVNHKLKDSLAKEEKNAQSVTENANHIICRLRRSYNSEVKRTVQKEKASWEESHKAEQENEQQKQLEMAQEKLEKEVEARVQKLLDERLESETQKLVNERLQSETQKLLNEKLQSETQKLLNERLQSEMQKFSEEKQALREQLDAEKNKFMVEELAKFTKMIEAEKYNITQAMNMAIEARQADLEASAKELMEKLEAEKRCLEAKFNKEKKDWANKLDATVKETKKQQWCAYCLKEARFYCCWNTSYCNVSCQSAHWQQHINQCENRRASSTTDNNTVNSPSTNRPMRTYSRKTVKSNINGRKEMPFLLPSGSGNSPVSIEISSPLSAAVLTKTVVTSGRGAPFLISPSTIRPVTPQSPNIVRATTVHLKTIETSSKETEHK